MIALGELRPGERLPAAGELADLVGVSRPTVLQALQVLARQGRVDVRRGSGAWVSALSAENLDARLAHVWQNRDEILQMFALREMLEAGIARRIAIVGLGDDETAEARSLIGQMQATDDDGVFRPLDIAFHRVLTGTLRLPLVEDTLRDSRARAAAVFEFLPYPVDRLEQAKAEHVRLLEAIVARDLAAAAEAASDHINGSAKHAVELLSGDGTALMRAAGSRLRLADVVSTDGGSAP